MLQSVLFKGTTSKPGSESGVWVNLKKKTGGRVMLLVCTEANCQGASDPRVCSPVLYMQFKKKHGH